MNYVVDKVKEEQKEDVSILTHPPSIGKKGMFLNAEGPLLPPSSAFLRMYRGVG